MTKDASGRRGPPRTGCVEPLRRADGTIYFRARVRLADGTRVRVDIPERYCVAAGGKTARERAELYAEALQEREDETGELLAERNARRAAKHPKDAKGNAFDAFWNRLSERRAAEGKKDTRHETWTVRKYLSPRFGSKETRAITRDDCEDLRDFLDSLVRERIAKGPGFGISGKTAMNVWSYLRIAMKEAVASRDRSMRCRADDPTHGIKPPLTTKARKKTFLYPVEFAKLVACESVPRDWRELYAVACMLYLRPGELRALTFADVDLDARVVHVTKAYDEKARKVGGTKSEMGIRTVPIEPALAPLLERMKRGREPTAHVAPLLALYSEQKRAGMLRAHLVEAGVTRPRLTENSATVMAINFRSCRDSGITWLALAGVDIQRIRSRARAGSTPRRRSRRTPWSRSPPACSRTLRRRRRSSRRAKRRKREKAEGALRSESAHP